MLRNAGLVIPCLQEIETDRTLGEGSYGKVVKVRVNGKLYAAKKLHEVFRAHDVCPAEQSAMAVRFEKECRRVLQLEHRNIVEMIGVYFDPVTKHPSLVMELMDTSLCSYLESNPSTSVTVTTKCDILLDVASGLEYLHTIPQGPIMHRDLTANNVLLVLGQHMVAKISDFGQAKNDPAYVHPARRRGLELSQLPGNEDHMPPEARSDQPVYNAALDMEL